MIDRVKRGQHCEIQKLAKKSLREMEIHEKVLKCKKDGIGDENNTMNKKKSISFFK